MYHARRAPAPPVHPVTRAVRTADRAVWLLATVISLVLVAVPGVLAVARLAGLVVIR